MTLNKAKLVLINVRENQILANELKCICQKILENKSSYKAITQSLWDRSCRYAIDVKIQQVNT